MDPNSAAENLQVIRTLMERSALYRRALAPVMLCAGVLGILGAFIGDQFHLDTFQAFVIFWFTIAAIVIGISLFIARRQALSSQEPFWTPPTRQVIRAMTPPLVAGFLIALSPSFGGFPTVVPASLVLVWTMLYGCALHSAGLFVSRGVRSLGWSFIMASIVIGQVQLSELRHLNPKVVWGLDVNEALSFGSGVLPLWYQPNALMGLTFGGFHLLASLYLYATEKRKNAQ